LMNTFRRAEREAYSCNVDQGICFKVKASERNLCRDDWAHKIHVINSSGHQHPFITQRPINIAVSIALNLNVNNFT
jgi:hypothetical protein